MAVTASSTIRQIGLPVSRESLFSKAFVSGRIDATSFGYSLVLRGLPFASASAGGRPGSRFRLSVAAKFSIPRYYRFAFLAIYNSWAPQCVPYALRPAFTLG
jgi:type VI protein secretion system component VasK